MNITKYHKPLAIITITLAGLLQASGFQEEVSERLKAFLRRQSAAEEGSTHSAIGSRKPEVDVYTGTFQKVDPKQDKVPVNAGGTSVVKPAEAKTLTSPDRTTAGSSSAESASAAVTGSPEGTTETPQGPVHFAMSPESGQQQDGEELEKMFAFPGGLNLDEVFKRVRGEVDHGDVLEKQLAKAQEDREVLEGQLVEAQETKEIAEEVARINLAYAKQRAEEAELEAARAKAEAERAEEQLIGSRVGRRVAEEERDELAEENRALKQLLEGFAGSSVRAAELARRKRR